MSLTVYDKKRDFKRTPEPRSVKASAKKTRLSFVVQKHDATRLHYDFRLEMDGVLKSWAIPKGPSMIAGEKRLAIMVEDHPLKYGKFFGEIPEGNYGAGTVEIWDKGTYIPSIETEDPQETLLEMLKKGDIKFSLKGTYLKGRFAIFNLKNDEKPNEWMLVKKADEFALDVFDIEGIQSLKTKKNADRRKSKKEDPDPFPDPLPKPMLAQLAGDVPDKPAWIYEMKLDGYRMLCSVKDGNGKLVSRGGNNYTEQFKILLEDLGKIEENLILDGEVVSENAKGLSDFQLLQNYVKTRKGDLKYYIFDLLYLNGHNIMNIPLLKRRDLLGAFFRKYKFRRISVLGYQTGDGKDLFKKLSLKGYEGIIAKDPESRYLPGKRTGSWLKIKSVMKQEAVICGYTLPQGGRKYFGSIIMGLFEDGSLKYIGNCGTGFSDASLKELYRKFELLKTDKCPFPAPPDLSWSKGRPVWLEPELVASIKFLEWSDDEIMRNPVFLGLREDKDPREVINETKVNSRGKAIRRKSDSGTRGKKEAKVQEQEKPVIGSKEEKGKTLILSGENVKLTNLTKIYWPGEGYTKGDLISYYLNISKFILPYLTDRPQSLNRHPHGIEGESFFQKDMNPEQVPGWVKTITIKSGTNPDGIDYLICNNVATLVFMANLGCIEINPWHSTYKKPDYPSYIVLDLDPGDVPFADVVATALVIKELCDEIKVPCYPKTSGATGLHIYIPLDARYDYEQAKTFAELLAVIAHSRLPLVTSLERTVSKRKDRVYIDYLQNRKGQTIAAPYSVRPRAFATVSAPLEWKEVNNQLSPGMFTIKNFEKRLQKVGDLWQPVIKSGISIARAIKAIEKLS